MVVEGKASALIDLSTVGAQVLSPAALKPNQRVGVGLVDDLARVTFSASVAWTKFEMPPSNEPVFRSGIDFVDADGASVDAFCARHKA